MIGLEQRVLDCLKDDGGSSLWESLMALFKDDPEAFYLLAREKMATDAPARLMELAELARRVRAAVRGSYQIETAEDGTYLVCFAGARVERTFVPPNLATAVARFLRAIDGKGSRNEPGKDYEGSTASDAEALFQLGDRGTWEPERERLERKLDSIPLVLHLDPVDIGHLAAQPGYVSFSLRECARRMVLAPIHVYRDLKRGAACPENLREAMAFCGKPRRAVDSSGRFMPAPMGMVFVVYADSDGYVFDWDWVEENPRDPGCPIDPEIRFGSPVDLGRDASLVLPDPFPEPCFDWTQACYSPRGDCIFCYISDEVSYASRTNSDLTVFRALANHETITGFKIKNVRRILEEDRDIVLEDDPELVVSVQSALLATLKGDKNASVRIYDVFIEAWKKAEKPPVVRVPKRPVASGNLAPA